MSDSETNRNKYEKWVMPLIAEFIGMLLFTFMHSMAAQSLPIIASALNDGLFVAIMVITIGHISGAHVNTAVTIAVTLSGGLKWVMAPLYIVVQLVGSLCGAGLARVAFGSPTGYFALGPGVDAGQGVLTEIMMSILLVFAVLQSAVDLGSPIAAFAIGFSIVIDILIGARISGASMNPSLSFGPAVVAGAWDDYWIYWVGPICGALIAVILHKLALASAKNRIFLRGSGSDYEDSSTKRRDSEETNQVSPV